MGKFLDLFAQKRGEKDGSKMEREGEKKGKAVLKQANKDALASQKLQEALLAPSVKKSRTKKEAEEVVDHRPASEMGAPEFAEESVFSLLEASQFAEPADVNAFLETVQDQDFADVLKNKNAFASFVAKRIVRESMESILSRPIVADSVLERSLAMHPKTKENVQAVVAANNEGGRIYTELAKLGLNKQKLETVVEDLRTTGLAGEQIEAIQTVVIQLELQLEAARQQKDANQALQTALTDQSKADASALEASYRSEMVSISERLGETLQAIAGLSPAAIGRDTQGRLQLDIEKLSNEALSELTRLLEQAAAQGTLSDSKFGRREQELNLRVLLETEWMQDFAHQYLKGSEPKGSHMTLFKYDPQVPLIWSTMMDVLKTSRQERQQDSAVLSKFLATERALFSKGASTASIEGGRVTVPSFEQEMPSSLSLVIERAKLDDKLAKELFTSGGPLIEDRLRAIYPDHIWNSAREPVVADIQSIMRSLGPRYRDDRGFQELISRVVSASTHQASTEQRETLHESIAPYVDSETKKVLGGAISDSIYGGRQFNRFRLHDERRTNPKFSRLVELLRKIDSENDLIRWIDWQDYKISDKEYERGSKKGQ